MKADIATLPLFLRSGAVIPMGPYMQYATEKEGDPLDEPDRKVIYKGESTQIKF
jgi:alpha-glucosidase (family GH31 glycosyl hydrolase)